MSLKDVGIQVRQGHEPTRGAGTLEPADDKLPLGRADLISRSSEIHSIR